MNGRSTRATLPLLALAVVFTPMGVAASEDNTARNFAETVAKTTTETEEVIVSGRLDRLSDVQKAITAAEDRFFNRYNELNKNRDYDVRCLFEKPTGTQIPSRHCEAGYVTEGKRDAAVYGLLRYGAYDVRTAPDSGIVLSRLPELQKKMRETVAGDEELQRALVERSLLIDRYSKLRKKKFDGRRAVWD